MIKLISNGFSWVLGKLGISPQLAIGYALMLVAVGGLGMGTALWYANKSLQNTVETQGERIGAAEVTISNQQVAIDQQASTIKLLSNLRKLDNESVTGLVSEIKSLAIRDRTVQQRLATLEKTNGPIQEYLASVVPPDVACLFNDTCPASESDRDGEAGDAAAASGTVAPMRQGQKK